MDRAGKPSGIGAALRRREDPRLLTGQGCYSADFNLPGQAYAAVLRSPYAHARILAIDTAEARAMPGVLAVLTGADYASEGLQPMAHAPAAQSPRSGPGRPSAGGRSRPRRREPRRVYTPVFDDPWAFA